MFKHLYASIEKESNMLLKCFRTNNAVNTYNQLVAAQGFRTVSYTHLRAHETKANLVCRLLLEKKLNEINYNNFTSLKA